MICDVQTIMTEQVIRRRFEQLRTELDERGCRIWAASEAALIGFGGVRLVSQATGLAESTVRLGKQELRTPKPRKVLVLERRVRRSGAGRKALTFTEPELPRKLERLVEPSSRGHPMSPLRWTLKSTRKLAEELTAQGYPVSHAKVGQILDELGYSLQGTRKVKEGSDHPDRNGQFEHIAKKVSQLQSRGQPVVSVDTKKKELVGNFANSGQEFRRKGQPVGVRVHDFVDAKLGKAIPYGVYDLTANAGWVSVGVDHDTAEFAVQTVRTWWRQMGRRRYGQATELLITADGGGSNASRNRLWKYALQQLSDEIDLKISVCHFPPGTSKWNKIEHRMFCWITQNWRGKPLTSHAVIVNLIANTTTKAGLSIKAALDTGNYPKGIKVTNEQMAALKITPSDFHGEWNYTVEPRS